MIKSFHQQDNLLGVSRLRVLVNNLEGSQSHGFNEQMLIDQVSSVLLNWCIKVLFLSSCLFVESTQSLEKPHDLRFAQNVREYLEISAELEETFKTEEFCLLISVKLKVRDHRFMDAPQQLHYFIVFQYFHQLDDLSLA